MPHLVSLGLVLHRHLAKEEVGVGTTMPLQGVEGGEGLEAQGVGEELEYQRVMEQMDLQRVVAVVVVGVGGQPWHHYLKRMEVLVGEGW